MGEEMTPERRNELADQIGQARAGNQIRQDMVDALEDVARMMAEAAVTMPENDDVLGQMALRAANAADFGRREIDDRTRYLNHVADEHGIPRPPGPSTPRVRTPDEQALADRQETTESCEPCEFSIETLNSRPKQ